MSQEKVTIPITVGHSELPGALYSGTGRVPSPDSDTARFQFMPNSDLPPHGPFDPWKLRDDFLSWPIEDWKSFVSLTGSFGPFQVSKRDFERWQNFLKAALVCPPGKWKTLRGKFGIPGGKIRLVEPAFSVRFEWNGNSPIARITTNNSLEAIIATIWVDALQGAEFRTCARPDCKNPPFRIEARQKIYCSSDCAHLVAVRNSRKRARKGAGRRRK